MSYCCKKSLWNSSISLPFFMSKTCLNIFLRVDTSLQVVIQGSKDVQVFFYVKGGGGFKGEVVNTYPPNEHQGAKAIIKSTYCIMLQNYYFQKFREKAK